MYVIKKKLRERNLECRTSQDSNALDWLARTNIANVHVMLEIIHNGYTSPETLDYIVSSYMNGNVSKSSRERVVILKALAERKDLSIKSAFKMALMSLGEVTSVLSRTTTYPEIQKILLKRCNDQTVIGNILKATEDHKIINDFIDTFNGKESTDICKSNYILVSLHMNPSLTKEELIRLIQCDRILPEYVIKHKNTDEEVYRELLNTVKVSEMTPAIAKELLLSEYICSYESVLKIIILKYPSIDNLKIVLNQKNLSHKELQFVYDNFKEKIANSCLLEYAICRFCKQQIIELLQLAKEIKGKVIVELYNLYGYTDLEILEYIAEKACKSDYVTIQAYLNYMPICYWMKFYNRLATVYRLTMLENFKCPKEILLRATNSSVYEVVYCAAKHSNADLEVALAIYTKIKSAQSMNNTQNRQIVFKYLEKRFGNQFIDELMRSPTNKDLYVIFIMTDNKELKYNKIVPIIGDRYLNKIIKLAIQTQNRELYNALKKNFNVSVENMSLLMEHFE